MLSNPYQSAIDALYACAQSCEECATACLEEAHVDMLAECIRRDRDCAEICRATSVFLARRSEHAQHLCRECAEICHICAEECERHDMLHCRLCAEACRRCIEECRKHIG